MNQLLDILKSTMPFQMVPENLLQDIAGICRHQSCKPGDELYDIGDIADDVYIVSSGSVEHTLGKETHASEYKKILGKGGMFGWASVLDGQNSRLAKTVCIKETEIIRIDGKALTRIFENDPAVGDVVMSRFAAMINKEFTVPEAISAQVQRFKPISNATNFGSSGSEWPVWL